MNHRWLAALGVPAALEPLARRAVEAARAAGLTDKQFRRKLAAVVRKPDESLADPAFAELARALLDYEPPPPDPTFLPRERPGPWRQWGSDIDPQAVRQMEAAMQLSVSVAGALMPDAHVGYGLPIGGVLATDRTVIPYAVGVDIACRMKLSVFDAPPSWLDKRPDRLAAALEEETRFGMGASFGSGRSRGRDQFRTHPVLDDDWSVSPVTMNLRDKARAQLGTSGSGNHFVEFGTLEVDAGQATAFGLPAGGTYLALLSHSGSRGTGAAVCDHYSRLAMSRCSSLPKELRQLAWLSLDDEAGQEYWRAMQLMGRYAAANHAVIHREVAKHLGLEAICSIENHHNFAWEEEHEIDGRKQTVIVHRKGATPAAAGVLGIIPGSMATPGFVVRGRGVAASLTSASHGAGRAMSRTQARTTYRWAHVKRFLADRGVQLLTAGIDEVPFAYKDIHAVMAAQADLVETLGEFHPRLVKMAPEGEKPED
jgi:tRNA-splicing ligase RtcB